MVDLIPSSESVMEILKQTGAYRKGHFVYPNGKHASHYFQMPLAFRYYDNARILSVGLSRHFRMDKAIAKALPKALELPKFPPGTTIQSGTCQRRLSSTRNMIVFCPSSRKGLTLLTR